MATSIIAQIKKKKSTDTKGTIYIRGYYNRKPVASITTGQTILLSHWDAVNRLVQPQAPNAALINTIIKTKVQAMQKRLLQVEVMGSTVNRQHVIKAVRNIDESRDFYKWCWQQICTYTSKETLRTYNTEVTKLQQYRNPLSFADIDYAFLSGYKMYMAKQLGNKPNTIWKSLKFVATMINKAIKTGGIITHNPFADFDRGKYVQTKRTWLEISHCDKIEPFTLHKDETIRKTAIYFLLMAYSGMRYSDAIKFDPEKHVQDGRIVMQYQKAKTLVENKMWDRLAIIVEKVRANRLQLSNQKFNQQCKLLAGLAGIDIKLSAHVGRHTMGGLLAESNVPENEAQLILGHNDIRSTRVYYHQKLHTRDRALQQLNNL